MKAPPTRFTKNKVRQIAEMLMLLNGSTTASEVRRWLQLEGYSVQQKQLLSFMQEIAQKMRWVTCTQAQEVRFSFRINMAFSLDSKLPPFGYN